MPLESATYVDDLVSTNPLGTDDASLGDDHIRLIKSVLKNTFPNLDGALTTKLAALNGVSQLITVGSDGNTLTFNFPSGGTVGNVTDWTSNQPVPASQADVRYVRNLAGNQGGIVSAAMDASGVPSFQSGTGNWYPVQLKGDYATNSALNTEITNRTNADTNLQNQINTKAALSGATFTGPVSVGYGAGWGGSSSLRWGNGALWFGNPDNSASAVFEGLLQVTDVVGDANNNKSGINIGGYNFDGTRFDWYLAWNGNITTPKGLVAFQSDLPRTFISAQQGVQTNYKYVIPHNLGRVPDAFWAYLVNVSSDWGYNPGQITIPSFDDKNNGGFGPLPVTADSWNIFLPMSDAVPLVSRMDPSNGDNQLGDRHSISADSWRFVFYAVCMRG